MTTDPDNVPANDSPRAWANLARRKLAEYQRLLRHGAGDVSLGIGEHRLAELVPHLADAIDALYVDLRAANVRATELGHELAALNGRNHDTEGGTPC